MILNARATVVVPCERQVVFDRAVTIECFKETLHSFGPIPGIADGEMLDGAPLETGACRRIELVDGTVIDEDIVEFIRPVRHCYRWTGGLRAPLSWLVRGANACWVFSDVEEGTRIEWSYAFELSTALAYPIALPFTFLFQGWQTRGLARVRQAMIDEKRKGV